MFGDLGKFQPKLKNKLRQPPATATSRTPATATGHSYQAQAPATAPRSKLKEKTFPSLMAQILYFILAQQFNVTPNHAHAFPAGGIKIMGRRTTPVDPRSRHPVGSAHQGPWSQTGLGTGHGTQHALHPVGSAHQHEEKERKEKEVEEVEEQE